MGVTSSPVRKNYWREVGKVTLAGLIPLVLIFLSSYIVRFTGMPMEVFTLTLIAGVAAFLFTKASPFMKLAVALVVAFSFLTHIGSEPLSPESLKSAIFFPFSSKGMSGALGGLTVVMLVSLWKMPLTVKY